MTNNEYDYIIENGELKSFTKSLGDIVWSGKPKGVDVVSFMKIPKSEDCIILLDWTSPYRLKITNVLRVTPSGEVIWEVDVPDKYKNILGINRQSDIENL